KKLLSLLDITVAGHVVKLGGISVNPENYPSVAEIKAISEKSELRVIDPSVEQAMKDLIDQTKKNGDTIGGIVEVQLDNVPAGLGSYVQWDKKLDAKIAQAVVSINAFKAVEFGIGFEMANLPGSQVMDEIQWDQENGYTR